MPSEVLVSDMESALGNFVSAELFDLRARETGGSNREPSNIVRINQSYVLSVRIRFTGPGLAGIVPNHIHARFYLEGVGPAPEIQVPAVDVIINSSSTEVLLQTPGLSPIDQGLAPDQIFRVSASVDVMNPSNHVERMSGYIEGAILKIRSAVLA